MSIRAILWALEDAVCPSPQAKLTLVIFGNFASDKNLAYPALSTVQKMTGLDERTIRRCVSELERDGLLVDTGQRVGRTKNVRVFALPVPTPTNLQGLGSKPVENSKPISGLSETENRTPTNLQGFADEVPSNPCNYAGVTPANMRGEPVKEPIPLETAKAVSVPTGTDRPSKGHRISEDWSPPPVGELDVAVAAIVAHWPQGSYAAQADSFRDHWLAESGPKSFKRDWDRAWNGWIRRSGKVSAPPVAPAPSPVATVATPPRPVAEQAAEDDGDADVRRFLADVFGHHAWFQACGFRRCDPGLKIFVPGWMVDHVPSAVICKFLNDRAFFVDWVNAEPGDVRR